MREDVTTNDGGDAEESESGVPEEKHGRSVPPNAAKLHSLTNCTKGFVRLARCVENKETRILT